MPLNKELAAVLRTARALGSMTQQDLGDASDRKHLWLMENARSSPTLNKFSELAQALGFSPVTLMALCVSLRDGVSAGDVMELCGKELEAFEAAGGTELLLSHLAGEMPTSRSSERLRKLKAVQECKQQGLTQKATRERLGISRSTVSELWRLEYQG